ncbi:ATP-dependent DNA helicase RecG, partial [Candidatus Roizmanbacteria bacterium CG11_big_fil_rev_8_21_14_0_20_36_8]
IDEMPKGRKIIKTYVTPEQKRANGYEWIRNQISNDNVQAYVVCPLIENSDSETMTSVRAATDVFKHLKDDIFPNFSLALLHGKLKSREKKQIMEDFNAKKYQILVSTSVVEVGIDVSNATIMIIEGAERFGLAQLHQLRGRIGRGEKQSYCFLFTSNHYQQKQKRLQFFASTNSGLALAEYDLKNRGPGELYGTKQHGYSDLKIADIMDTKSVNIAQTAVKEFTDNYKLDDHEYLKSCIESYQINQIARD